MGVLRHLVTAVGLVIVFGWLWRSSLKQKAKEEPGRKLFPPTRAMQILTAIVGVFFTFCFVASSLALRKPDEWWVPYSFLGFVFLAPLMYPPTLSIETDGVASRTWFGSEKKIRWEDIASLHYNTGNKQFTVRAHDGRKIRHAGFNADPSVFQFDIQSRTRLPLKLSVPGGWKTETVEVPFEELQADEETTPHPATDFQ